jgi:hypothetical protein
MKLSQKEFNDAYLVISYINIIIILRWLNLR